MHVTLKSKFYKYLLIYVVIKKEDETRCIFYQLLYFEYIGEIIKGIFKIQIYKEIMSTSMQARVFYKPGQLKILAGSVFNQARVGVGVPICFMFQRLVGFEMAQVRTGVKFNG